ncbi:serine-threonine protein kinase [Bifidobacterium tissieri]|uniref:non-specific serine/threonine protein kinase n=1 Tax=Bifidobacterium tissieri TaxID=1630162 RepID=A0A261FBP1_9BIFI|nr:serine-threonine protein kinase [Bifidobacterium tissieri]
MRLIEGQLIHRRYRLDQRLAQGGMGEVWKGYDIELERPVAIKALRADMGNEEAKLKRLRAEAHNSANLAHPNIAALFEYYEHDNIGFLIMEYVPNKSLAEIYKARGPLSTDELLPILIQTARGLYVAHSHGVIHRDVKPANIMVSETGEVKITDFGVSYSTNQAQITQDGMVVGTAQYISPEQAQGEQATPQSDIYSLGVVAYEGLCGHRPFTGATPVDIAAAHVNDPVPPLPDSIDWQLREFVMSMLAKDPADRPANALVVSRTLAKIERRLLDQEASEALTETGHLTRRVMSAPHQPIQLFSAADWVAKQTPRPTQTTVAPAVTQTPTPAAAPEATIVPPAPITVPESAPDIPIPDISLDAGAGGTGTSATDSAAPMALDSVPLPNTPGVQIPTESSLRASSQSASSETSSSASSASASSLPSVEPALAGPTPQDIPILEPLDSGPLPGFVPAAKPRQTAIPSTPIALSVPPTPTPYTGTPVTGATGVTDTTGITGTPPTTDAPSGIANIDLNINETGKEEPR